jgi:hypothetical protein
MTMQERRDYPPDRPIPIRYETENDEQDRFGREPPSGRGGGSGGRGPGLGPRELRVIGIMLGLAVIVAALVLPPLSLIDRSGGESPAGSGIVTRARDEVATLPQGLEAVSSHYDIEGDRNVQGPITLTVRLSQAAADTKALAFYTHTDGQWRRLTSVGAAEGGRAVQGELSNVPANIAVLRREALAHAFGVIVGPGEEPDADAADAGIISVLGGEPAPGDEGLQLSSRLGSSLDGRYLGVTTSTTMGAASANRILGDPSATRRHIDAIASATEATQAAGVHVDYIGLDVQRRGAFTTFVQQLSERLKQTDRGLVVSVPTPVGNETGAYDWAGLAGASDGLWLRPPTDPAAYYDTLEGTLRAQREGGVDLRKVSLVIDRRSRERSGDLIRAITLRDALTTASTVRTRLEQGIGPGDAVTLTATNIDQDAGNSGFRWDSRSRSVMYAYAGRMAPRTVWIENRFSVAFRLDLARRYGLGGVVVESAARDEMLPDVWDTILAYVAEDQILLELPYGPYLQPSWRAAEGQIEAAPASGVAIWRAPPRTGIYDITLIVSDGVVFVGQQLALRVTAEGARTPTPTPSSPTPTAAPR